MEKQAVLPALKGGLIVSCQALPEEPLHSPYIMGRMAYAAYLGGACGIRANSVEDIHAIRDTVTLPMIGIIKRVKAGSDVYITPTFSEIEALAASGVEIVAMDATPRGRVDGSTVEGNLRRAKEAFPHLLFMADCSTYEEGMRAVEVGFDCVGTTLSGYTDYTKGRALPDYPLIEALARDAGVPVVAEGGIWEPGQLRRAYEAGAYTCVVGSAISRPMEITKRFVKAIQ